jgi:integrase
VVLAWFQVMAMKVLLTDKTLRAIEPAPKGRRFKLFDSRLSGFGVSVTDRGVVSFFVARRRKGDPQPMTIVLGRYGDMSLSEAREQAETVLMQLRRGEDPRVRPVADDMTLGAVAEAFIARHVSKLRDSARVESRIRRELIARWGDRAVKAVSRRDIVTMLDSIIDKSGPEAARATLVYAKRLLSWAVQRVVYGLEHNVAVDVKARDLIGSARPRERFLNDDELRLVWQAAGDAYPVGPYIRLLILLGQRRDELAEAPWCEFDLTRALWTIPSERMKGKVTHLVPLPDLAVRMLKDLPQVGDWVFTSTGRCPFSSFGPLKRDLDAAVTKLNGGQPLPHWTLRDLRRTCRTGLGALKVAPHVAERVIAHRQRGVVRVYDLHEYLDERREALELWAAHVIEVTDSPQPAVNVVRLRA